MPQWRIAAGCAAAAVLTITGCGSLDERRTAASEAALAFEEALRTGDGAAACEALAPGTRDELVKSSGALCPRAVLEEELSPAGTVRRVDVHGRQARVRLAGDTLFLAGFDDGWKVVAAGCEPRPEQPYDCTVKGG
ncbi:MULTISPECIES: hypothetical protein [Streptomyces]|uniref:Lipoprotein n=1 Tax=Streptomyces lycii TaxID=2654337 RepID=A0ABQ7FGE4_9ACTN|nr:MULTISPECIES: hypothetical protein [Streptomyces]KAF4407628.1 hypothetical protein GCU69_18715 [Streptomyces lycii]